MEVQCHHLHAKPTLNHNDISSIIKNLDSNKAHGCDNISIKMINK